MDAKTFPCSCVFQNRSKVYLNTDVKVQRVKSEGAGGPRRPPVSAQEVFRRNTGGTLGERHIADGTSKKRKQGQLRRQEEETQWGKESSQTLLVNKRSRYESVTNADQVPATINMLVSVAQAMEARFRTRYPLSNIRKGGRWPSP